MSQEVIKECLLVLVCLEPLPEVIFRAILKNMRFMNVRPKDLLSKRLITFTEKAQVKIFRLTKRGRKIVGTPILGVLRKSSPNRFGMNLSIVRIISKYIRSYDREFQNCPGDISALNQENYIKSIIKLDN